MSDQALSKKLSGDNFEVVKISYNQQYNHLTLHLNCAALINAAQKSDLIGNVKEALPFLKAVFIDECFSEQINCEEALYWLLAKRFNDSVEHIKQCVKITQTPHSQLLSFNDTALYYRFKQTDVVRAVQDELLERFGHQITLRLTHVADEASLEAEFEAQIAALITENLPSEQPVTQTAVKADDVIVGKRIKGAPTPLTTDFNEGDSATIKGELIRKELRETRAGSKNNIINLVISDHSDAVKCVLYVKKSKTEEIDVKLREADYYLINGYFKYDSYARENIFNVRAINAAEGPAPRLDTAEDKRVEFHLHTNMSAMDGISSIDQYIKCAKAWQHPAITITDHAVVQAFPDAMHHETEDFKINYGLEAYMVDDSMKIIDNLRSYSLRDTFVVFDIETTGFSPRYDGITEIGAIKVKDGAIIDRYSQLVNPQKKIPAKVVELTGITDQMVANQPIIDEVLPEFLAFCGDCPVVAHNAPFDIAFIVENAKRLAIDFTPMVLDTLKLSRILLKKIKRFALNRVARYLGVSLENHHRAVDDALATAKIFIILINQLIEQDVSDSIALEQYGKQHLNIEHYDSYHVILLARNQAGLKDLYQLVSHSHIDTYHKKPLLKKSLIAERRQHLLIGSACAKGEIFSGLLAAKSSSEMREIASFYDYIEVQPAANHSHLISEGLVKDRSEIEQYNARIIALADSLNTLCIATGDAHYLNPEDEIYRRILMAGKGYGNSENQAPLYFRTTQEMLEEFNYLGNEKAYQLVVINSLTLNSQIARVKPVPAGTYPPKMEGADQALSAMCYAKARSIYGDELPDIVDKRLKKELDAIINNGYAVMYVIAQKLVKRSNEDGFIVGSRGSVGSSFAATMADITEVNPLPAHYYCAHCQYSNFDVDESVKIGPDLADATCPRCQSPLKKEGFDIPFETFLGFEGDKEPDIDLNFAGVYQAISHAYTEQLFGEGYTFKAGTIGTIAQKTAFGYAMKYKEERGLSISNYEVERLAKGCVGVKRTTGQHPGGIMVVPHDKDIHDFSPIQYPANDASSAVLTTHFDYHSISGKILKLDILGHDVPTIIKTLEDFTGVNYQEIPLDDAATLSLFRSPEALGILDADYPIDSGTLGIPEFGTNFVRGMLKETLPSTIEELVQISGLSHGTDVWRGNAQDLIKNGKCTLKEVIGIRDNIMLYLIDSGIAKKDAFFITEAVRKGRGLTAQQEAQMRQHEVPNWYIDSCKKISYMFPKAHAAAYVMSSLRIAYYKVHHPLAYYATYFTSKVDDFDADLISRGKEVIHNKMKQISALDKPTNKEENLYIVLESALELYCRGLTCLKVDLYASDALRFLISNGAILPPLRALQGVGQNVAEAIASAREDGEFISVNDIKSRAKANRSVIEALRAHGVLAGLPEDNQLSLDFFMT